MGVTAPPRTGAAMSVESAAAGPPPFEQTPAGTPGWNVIVTLPEATAPQARRILRRWGWVHRTGYFHVLVMAVPDPDRFVHESGEAVAETPGILNFIAAPRTREREEDAIGEPQIIDLPLTLARGVPATMSNHAFGKSSPLS